MIGASILAALFALNLVWLNRGVAWRRELITTESAARIQTFKTALEIRHDIALTPASDQRRRLGLWMRAKDPDIDTACGWVMPIRPSQ
jgi:hypothetical protein